MCVIGFTPSFQLKVWDLRGAYVTCASGRDLLQSRIISFIVVSAVTLSFTLQMIIIMLSEGAAHRHSPGRAVVQSSFFFFLYFLTISILVNVALITHQLKGTSSQPVVLSLLDPVFSARTFLFLQASVCADLPPSWQVLVFSCPTWGQKKDG